MKIEDYRRYYIQGGDHYLIPSDMFEEIFDEMQNWKEQNEEHKEINGNLRITIKKLENQLKYLRSGEYLNQLKFERDMLEEIVEHGEVSKEDKEFIDMTHRNTELIEENERLKTQLSGTTFCYDEEEHKQLEKENQELKKQLEKCYCNRTDCVGRIKDSKKYDSLVQTQETQQKEFVKWLEDMSIMYENEYKDIDVAEHYKCVLQKYKKLIGVSDENN